MKKLFFLFIVFHSSFSFSQSFKLQISPKKMTVAQGDVAQFNVAGIPLGGFNSSIYLSETAPSCVQSCLNLSPKVLNSPYNNCNITVSTTANLFPGDYKIVVKGENSSVVSYDTCYLTVTHSIQQQWQVFTSGSSGLTFNTITDIAVDSLNNYWLAVSSDNRAPNGSRGCLAYYDGSNWEIWTSNKDHYITDNCGIITSQDKTSTLGDNGDIYKILIDKHGVKWIATANHGLIRYDGKNWKLFTPLNSAIPCNYVFDMQFDDKENLWIASGFGLTKYDGTTWTTYNTSNSYIPDNRVNSLAIEKNFIWLGTGYGLVKFDGQFWTTYNVGNSGIPNSNVYDLKIDANNVKWMGTQGSGLTKFDGNTWTTYNRDNSPLQTNYIGRIKVDKFNNKWINLEVGFAKFDEVNWTFFNTSNSPLPKSPYTPTYNDIVYAVNFDHHNNMLIGMYHAGFIRVFSPNSPTSINEKSNSGVLNLGIFPNPASNNLNITGIAEKTKIRIYNILGELSIETNVDTDANIDIHQLLQGIYTIMAENNKGRMFNKVVVTR